MAKTFQDRLKIIIDRMGGRAGRANLSRASGVSIRSLGNYVCGDTEPKADVVARLADAAGVRVEWLLNGTEPMVVIEQPQQSAPLVAREPAGDYAADAARRVSEAQEVLRRLQADAGCDLPATLSDLFVVLIVGQQITADVVLRLLQAFRAEALAREPSPEPEIEPEIESTESIEGVTRLPEREPAPWVLVQPRRRRTDRSNSGSE